MEEVFQMTHNPETVISVHVVPEIGKWIAIEGGMVKPNMGQKDSLSEWCSRVGRNELS